MLLRYGTLLVLMFAVIGPTSAEDVIFIDREACPGEGCAYAELWFAQREVPLRAEPKDDARIITVIKPEQAAVTRYGEVHTKPARFVVRRPEMGFHPGDEVLVYTYLGEGHFKVRHNGVLKEAELGFSPWGGSSGKRCEIEEYCWGTLQTELEFTWWVNIVSESGLWGWVKGPDGFRVVVPSNPVPER